MFFLPSYYFFLTTEAMRVNHRGIKKECLSKPLISNAPAFCDTEAEDILPGTLNNDPGRRQDTPRGLRTDTL